MTSHTWQLWEKARARFPLQLMSLWVSGGGSAWRREGSWGERRKPSSPTVPSGRIRHASWTQTRHSRNTRRGTKRQEAARNRNRLHCPLDRRKWGIMGNTWAGEAQRHRRTVDRWASCLSDRLHTCQPGLRWAVDFQLKLIVFAN